MEKALEPSTSTIGWECHTKGITLDYKLNWRPHITERVTLALDSLARVSRTLGSSEGLSPELVIWVYKTPVLPVLEYGSVVCAGALQGSYAVSELTKVQCLACCVSLSAFPGTATVVMEALLCLLPLPLLFKGRAMAAMHRLKVWNRWRDFEQDGRKYLNSHKRSLRSAEKHLPVLSMPFDIIPSVRQRSFPAEFLILDRANEDIEAAARLKDENVSCNTDGSRLNGLSGRGYVAYRNGLYRFSGSVPLGEWATVFQAEVHDRLVYLEICNKNNLKGHL